MSIKITDSKRREMQIRRKTGRGIHGVLLFLALESTDLFFYPHLPSFNSQDPYPFPFNPLSGPYIDHDHLILDHQEGRGDPEVCNLELFTFMFPAGRLNKYIY
jgi:hypothetical protein